jgi:hypothetical protein
MHRVAVAGSAGGFPWALERLHRILGYFFGYRRRAMHNGMSSKHT